MDRKIPFIWRKKHSLFPTNGLGTYTYVHPSSPTTLSRNTDTKRERERDQRHNHTVEVPHQREFCGCHAPPSLSNGGPRDSSAHVGAIRSACVCLVSARVEKAGYWNLEQRALAYSPKVPRKSTKLMRIQSKARTKRSVACDITKNNSGNRIRGTPVVRLASPPWPTHPPSRCSFYRYREGGREG